MLVEELTAIAPLPSSRWLLEPETPGIPRLEGLRKDAKQQLSMTSNTFVCSDSEKKRSGWFRNNQSCRFAEKRFALATCEFAVNRRDFTTIDKMHPIDAEYGSVFAVSHKLFFVLGGHVEEKMASIFANLFRFPVLERSKHMRSRNLWALSWSLAFGTLISLTNLCLGDDNDGSKLDRQYNPANGQNVNQNRAQDQNGRSDNNSGDDATHHAALGVSLSDSDGRVTVIAVMPGSPAAKADLRVGDEIRYVGDDRIRSAKELTDEVSEKRPGAQVELSIRRNGEKQTLNATLGAQEAVFGARDRRDGTAYSYGSNGANDRQNDGSQQQMRQRLQSLQQQVSQLQQQINSLQVSLGNSRGQNDPGRNQGASNQMQNGAQQSGYYNNQQGQMLDRTGQRASTSRGWSRDHGPRETSTGNTANED